MKKDKEPLSITHPEIADEADGWDPSQVSSGSNKRYLWKCQFGHTWNAIVNNRTIGTGCPVCSNRQVLTGYNDLATTHPELAKEANGWDPRKVIAGSDKKLEWKCNQGHEWKVSPNNRTYGTGCPTCASFGYDPNKEAHIYFLIQPSWEVYQIGITNFPNDRLKRHAKNGFELLELRGPMDGHKAQELETAVLRYLKSQNADLSPEYLAGKFDGYSESWTIDSFKVNNLKELIDKAVDAGF